METHDQKRHRLWTLNNWRNESKASLANFKTQLEPFGLILTDENTLSPADSYEIRQLAISARDSAARLLSKMLSEEDFKFACRQLLETLGDRKVLLAFSNHQYVGLIRVDFSWLIANIVGLLHLDGEDLWVWDEESRDFIGFDYVAPDNYDPGHQISIRGDMFRQKIATSTFLSNLLSKGGKDYSGLPWMTPDEEAQYNLKLSELGSQRALLLDSFKAKLLETTGLVTSHEFSRKASFERILYRNRLLKYCSPPELRSPPLEDGDFINICRPLGDLFNHQPIEIWFKNHVYAGLVDIELEWVVANLIALLDFDGESVFAAFDYDSTDLIIFNKTTADNTPPDYQIIARGEKLIEKVRDRLPDAANWTLN